jgi:hypothetical protein
MKVQNTSPGRKKWEDEDKVAFEKTMLKIFFKKQMINNLPEWTSTQLLKRLSKSKSTPRHIVVKLKNVKNNRKFLKKTMKR